MDSNTTGSNMNVWLPNGTGSSLRQDFRTMNWLDVPGVGLVSIPLVLGLENESDTARLEMQPIRSLTDKCTMSYIGTSGEEAILATSLLRAII